MLHGSGTKQVLELYPQVWLLVGASCQSFYKSGRHCRPKSGVSAIHTFLDCRKYLPSCLVRKCREILSDCISNFSKNNSGRRFLCSPAF